MFFCSPKAYAGAWTQEKGGGFFKLDYSFIRAGGLFLDDGSTARFPTRLSNHNFSLYGEYGFHKRITGIAYVPFLVRNVLNRGIFPDGTIAEQTGVSTSSFGDIDLGLKALLCKKKSLVISGTLLFGVPSGKINELELNSTDTEFNVLTRLDFGYSYKSFWTSAGAGINVRTRGFSEEFRFDYEAGIKFWKDRIIVAGKIIGVVALRNGDVSATMNGLFSNNVTYISPRLILGYEYKNKVGVSFETASAFIGKNVLAAPSYSFGIYYKLAPKNKSKSST